MYYAEDSYIADGGLEQRISHADENWIALPQRLRGRGDWLLRRGRIKDAELMFDAATEIENLRASND